MYHSVPKVTTLSFDSILGHALHHSNDNKRKGTYQCAFIYLRRVNSINQTFWFSHTGCFKCFLVTWHTPPCVAFSSWMVKHVNIHCKKKLKPLCMNENLQWRESSMCQAFMLFTFHKILWWPVQLYLPALRILRALCSVEGSTSRLESGWTRKKK